MVTRGNSNTSSPDRSITVPRKSKVESARDPAETSAKSSAAAPIIIQDGDSPPPIPEAQNVGDEKEGNDGDERVSKMMEEIVDDVNEQRSELCMLYFILSLFMCSL